MMNTPATINSVPNEILQSILDLIPTLELLPLARVSHRLLASVQHVLHVRLVRAAALPDHRVILECYHPIAKISTPYLSCDFLYTDQLPAGSTAGETRGSCPAGLVGLRQLYSHFRPVVQEENRRPRLRYPIGGAQATVATDQTGEGSAGQAQAPALPDFASQDLSLEDGELFSQLCTVTNLVKLGPKRGLFLSHVNISEGVIRVWRKWLAQRADSLSPQTLQESPDLANDDDLILWADKSRNVGLRFRVEERQPQGQMPLLVNAEEEPPVSYRLEYEELLVRTNQLLLTVEKAEEQEVATSGKAIVIASF